MISNDEIELVVGGPGDAICNNCKSKMKSALLDDMLSRLHKLHRIPLILYKRQKL